MVTMSETVLLPAPGTSGSIKIGQLLADPLSPNVNSYHNENDALPLRVPTIQIGFEETVHCDAAGRFIGRQFHSSKEGSVLVQADQMSYTALRDSLSAFRYTSRRASSQAYLHQAALRRQPLYYVTAIQTLSNPRFTNDDPGCPTSSNPRVRRQDSGIALNEQDDNVILRLELRKVYCRIASPEDPQRPSDVDYAYKYYRLQGEEERQLAIGLGPAVKSGEFRTLLGSWSDADYTDASTDSDSFDDDEDEGCMCCSSSIANASYRQY